MRSTFNYRLPALSIGLLATALVIKLYVSPIETVGDVYALPNSYLSSNTTNAYQAAGTLITALSSTGFSVGASSLVNTNGDNYIAWAWKKSATAGVDIVTYTGTGVAHTIAHSLAATPTFLIVKRTDAANSWYVYHQSTGNTGYTAMNTTAAFAADATAWNNTTPTSANFTVGTGVGVNANGGTYTAYAFAEKAGFSKFGSYTANGSADGTFVYTGFKPKFVMMKRSDSTSDWIMVDTIRDTYNPLSSQFFANSSAAVTSATVLDSNANGFKLRTASDPNAGGTYYYAAFADYPFERATTNQGYAVNNSERFNGTNAYLAKTPGTSGSGTYTVSLWAKRSKLGTQQFLYSNRKDDGAFGVNYPYLSFLEFDSNDHISALSTCTDNSNTACPAAGINYYYIITNGVFRDPSAWYHIVLRYNGSSATLYVNGVQQSLSTNTQNGGGPSPVVVYSGNAFPLVVGEYGDFGGLYYSGYLADLNLIDGQALTPTSFGQFDSNGNWGPKSYTGSYGTNGFHLDFSNAASPGTDVSGNGNNFTNNNIATTDNMADTPMNNFPTLNSVFSQNGVTLAPLSQGNLVSTYDGAAPENGISSAAFSAGKWYAEVTSTNVPASNESVGIDSRLGTGGTQCVVYGSAGTQITCGVGTSAYGSTYTAGDVLGIAVDKDAGAVTFYKNGVSQGTISTPLTDALFVFDAGANSGSGGNNIWNFGQGGQSGLTYDAASGGYWKYTPPAGFKALSSANMITAGVSAIAKPKSYFDAITYIGNGTSQAITLLNFQPDLIWIKDRTSAKNHVLFGDGSSSTTTSSGGLGSFWSEF